MSVGKSSGKLVWGVGINDLDYQVQVKGYVEESGKLVHKLLWICPFYRRWMNMLKRCYCDKEKINNPTYSGITCTEEWLLASRFKSWMEQQDWKGKELDKDIIVYGNKLYSPEACAFVLQSTNTFVVDRAAARGEFKIGVCWDKERSKFMAKCKNPFSGKTMFLGRYSNELDAHEAWRKQKHEFAQLVAEVESDSRVKNALKTRYSSFNWYNNNPI